MRRDAICNYGYGYRSITWVWDYRYGGHDQDMGPYERVTDHDGILYPGYGTIGIYGDRGQGTGP